MIYFKAAILWVIFSLGLTASLGTQNSFAAVFTDEVRISPISLSANEPGLEVSEQLIERFTTRTDLSRLELEELGLKFGVVIEGETLAELLDVGDRTRFSPFLDFFDHLFGDASKKFEPRLWKRVSRTKAFIRDAISHGSFKDTFDNTKAGDLRNSLQVAAIDGNAIEQVEAREMSYQLLLEARKGAIRKARGFRQFADMLARELEGRVYKPKVGIVIEIRTNAKRPTISPLSLVRVNCTGEPSSEKNQLFELHEPFEFLEWKRDCGDFGVCRIESIASLEGGPKYKTLFDMLRSNGRKFLNKCSITTEMLIDGEVVVRELPGRFTSHLPTKLQQHHRLSR